MIAHEIWLNCICHELKAELYFNINVLSLNIKSQLYRLAVLVTGRRLMLHMSLMGNEVMSVKAFRDRIHLKITFSGHSLGLNISIT